MIVRGVFSTLLAPGFAKDLRTALMLPIAPTGYVAMGKLYVPQPQTQFVFSKPALVGFPFVHLEDTSEFIVMEAERMALIHPDTSEVPIWRRRPERSEHPLRAYRAWQIELVWDHSIITGAPLSDVYLSSVTMDTRYEGPVMRAHMKPVDPAVWDSDKSKLDETFRLAGIYAFKKLPDAKALGYPVWGEIAIWGRIAQFQLGYRAEVCMIKKLFLDGSRIEVRAYANALQKHKKHIVRWIGDKLIERYQCDVEIV